MSSVQCQFCSRRNAANAKFCVSCSMQFRRRRMTVACAALLLAIGMLVFWPTRSPVYVTSPVAEALPSEMAAPDEWSALAQRAVHIQNDFGAAHGNGAGATPTSVPRHVGACSAGMAALGLCGASGSATTKTVVPTGSSIVAVPEPTTDHTTARCNEAAVALGLCAE
jgi:hypothetical protein